jgi:hypothetical protein
MKSTLLLLVSMTLATLLASVVALVAPKEQAQTAFSSIKTELVFVRDGARGSHIFMTFKALKDWKQGATAGLLDAPRITLEPEAEIGLLLVLICWTHSRTARSEPA